MWLINPSYDKYKLVLKNGKISPDPSVSNKLKASLISSISSSLNPGLSYDFAALFDADFAFLDCYDKKNKFESHKKILLKARQQTIILQK